MHMHTRPLEPHVTPNAIAANPHPCMYLCMQATPTPTTPS
jgi:hypothetical protein